MILRRRLVHPYALTLGLIAFALTVMFVFVPEMTCAQDQVCARNFTNTFNMNLDGVVAPGAPIAGCNGSVNDSWKNVGPVQFQPANVSPDGKMYVALGQNRGDPELLVGLSVKGDPDLSDQDYVMLVFDRDRTQPAANTNTWEDGDFYLMIQVSNSSTSINSGTQCSHTTGFVEYYEHVGGFWDIVDNPGDVVQVSTAYDYSKPDPQQDIWNLEIRIPINAGAADRYKLKTGGGTPYFGMGAYVFNDAGHNNPSTGTTMRWPGTLAARLIEQQNLNTAPPVPNNLASVNLDNVCFDVRFLDDNASWQINNNSQETNDHSIFRNGQNTFRVTYYFDGPGDVPMSPVGNSGRVDLALKPYYVVGGAGTPLVLTRTVPNTPRNYNQTYAEEFTVNFANPQPGFEDIDNVNFICATMTLNDFMLDDVKTNNSLNVNFNYFTTSEYTQEVRFYGDSIPDLDPGESTTIYFQTESVNGIDEVDQPRESASAETLPADVGANISRIFSGGMLILQVMAVLFIVGLVLLVLGILLLLRHQRRGGLVLGLLGLILIVIALIILLPELQRPPRTPTIVATNRWELTNAEELGITPVEGMPNWYQMPISYEDVLTANILFTGQPLPYETIETRVEPSVLGKEFAIQVDVMPNSVATVLAFGEVDPDGPEGELAPTSATGFIENVDDVEGFLLNEGYYVPNEFSGALIGSFDGFESSFVIGRASSFVVPEDATTLWLGVNYNRSQHFATITGWYDLFFVNTPLPEVPTHPSSGGDATFRIPATYPMWDILTGLNLYSYYRVDSLDDNRNLVGRTYVPLGAARMSIYQTHLEDDSGESTDEPPVTAEPTEEPSPPNTSAPTLTPTTRPSDTPLPSTNTPTRRPTNTPPGPTITVTDPGCGLIRCTPGGPTLRPFSATAEASAES